MAELPDPSAIAAETETTLVEAEAHLLKLIHEGSRGIAPLDDVVDGFTQVITKIRANYRHLHEGLQRRDLTFEMTERLEMLRKRALWLYRKCRLEHFFFLKLRLERSLRESLYKLAVETFAEMSSLDEAERSLRMLHGESLALDLVGEDESLERQARAPSD